MRTGPQQLRNTAVAALLLVGCGDDLSETAGATATATISGGSETGSTATSEPGTGTSGEGDAETTTSGGSSGESDASTNTGEPPEREESCDPAVHLHFRDLGDGIPERPYQLCSAAQLASMRTLEFADLDASFAVVADIDLEPYYESGGDEFQIAEHGYTLGTFAGEIDGGGHTIANFRVDRWYANGGGLIANAREGLRLRGLRLRDFRVDTRGSAGLLVDSVSLQGGTIELADIEVIHGEIRGSRRVGGIVGAIIASNGVIDGEASTIRDLRVSGLRVTLDHHDPLAPYTRELGGVLGTIGASTKAEFVSRFVVEDVDVDVHMELSPLAAEFEEAQQTPTFGSVGGVIGTAGRVSFRDLKVRVSLEMFGEYTITRIGGIGGLIAGSDIDGAEVNLMTDTGYSNRPLFVGGAVGDLWGSELRDVTVADSVFEILEGHYCGGLVGNALESVIDGGVVRGTDVTCESFAGGVIGVAEGTKISNVRLEGSTVKFYGLSFIEAKAYGGIVGSLRAGSSLTRSSAEGAILRARHFGGIAGVCLEGSTIRDAFARLDVALDSEGIAGGALGTADGCSVKNVYTASTMTLKGGQPVEAVSGFVSAATSTSISSSWSAVRFSGAIEPLTQAGLVSSASDFDTVSLEEVYWTHDPLFPDVECLSATLKKLEGVEEPDGCVVGGDGVFKGGLHPVYEGWDPAIWSFPPGDFPTLN